MSNNAVAAYEDGKKPLSKWSKSKILDSLCVSEEEKKKLKKYCLDTLRQYFLRYSEWHHTSSHYNCTDFYEVVIPDRIDYETLDASEAFYRECIQVQKIKKAEESLLQMGELGRNSQPSKSSSQKRVLHYFGKLCIHRMQGKEKNRRKVFSNCRSLSESTKRHCENLR